MSAWHKACLASLVPLAFAATIVTGLTVQGLPVLMGLSTRLFHAVDGAVDGLACSATPADPFYRVMRRKT